MSAKKSLTFTPLGGVGEIGMNFALYRLGDTCLAVDCGVTFADEELPGAELIVPDPSALGNRKVDALLITHAHEDHLGAIPYLWRKLRCPVLLSGFAASILRRKLEEAEMAEEVPLQIVKPNARKRFGQLDVEWVGMPHSIPETNGLFIRTPLGNVFHSGDWNADHDPIIGARWDEEKLKALGKEGVDALVCDSTNVFAEKAEGSEKKVAQTLKKLLAARRKGRIGITFFASNVARMQSAAEAALANGRKPIRVGRSMGNYEAAARENGYLERLDPFIDCLKAGGIKPSVTLYMLTGCQGEARAALARIAKNRHPSAKLERGDAVLFSARVIPGNEKAVGKIVNSLMKRGVEVIMPDDELIHVSGHPSQSDLLALYRLLKPKSLIPVHGEIRHLEAHSKLATKNKIDCLVIKNGDVCRLLPSPLSVTDEIKTGVKVVFQDELVSPEAKPLRQRLSAAERGMCAVSLVMGKRDGVILKPVIITVGVFSDDETATAVTDDLTEKVAHILDKMPYEVCARAKKVEGIAASCLRHEFKRRLGLSPLISCKAVYV